MGMMVSPYRLNAGGGGGGTSYRYFFVEFLTSSNGFIAASTIKCLDSGGTDHALQSNGGTATVVGYTANGSFPVTNCNDGNDTSFTTSSAGTDAGANKGIQIDLGSVEAIVNVGIRNRSSGGAEAIQTGNIYGKVNSGDGWTLIRAISEPWTQQTNEYREFPFTIPSTATSTDWRIGIKTKQSGSGVSYAREIQLRETSGGPDTTTSQTFSASTGTAGNAFDDNTTTYWTGATGAWIGVTHGATKAIVEYTWQIHTATADGAKDVTVLYKNANGAWVAWWSPPSMVWTSADQVLTVTK